MSKPQAVHGILFDMDDTLIDWSGDNEDWERRERTHIRRVVDCIEEAGYTCPVSANELSAGYRERSMDVWEDARTTLRAPNAETIMQAVLQSVGFDIAETDLTIRDLMTAYGWRGGQDVVVFPDVPAGLEALLERDIKIGIVTNSGMPMWMREPELERFDLLRYFPDAALRISAADVGYLKPHPRIFTYALKKLGTAPEHTLYIGDNPTADIVGSQDSGMRGILRRLPKHNQSMMSALIVPDAEIQTFDDLVALVDKCNS